MADSNMRELLLKRLRGQQDARGPVGQFSRGSNVYAGGSNAAQQGGGNPNVGRPPTNFRAQVEQRQAQVQRGNVGTSAQKEALRRRLEQYRNRSRSRYNK